MTLRLFSSSLLNTFKTFWHNTMHIFKSKGIKLTDVTIEAIWNRNDFSFVWKINYLSSYKHFFSRDKAFFLSLLTVFAAFIGEVQLKMPTLTLFSEKCIMFTKKENILLLHSFWIIITLASFVCFWTKINWNLCHIVALLDLKT